jgi:hypothetical protein
MTSIMTGVTYKYKGVPIIEDITSASQTSSSSSSSTSSASQ